jgi:NhaA family Na+:H+ antiporter
MTQIIQRILRTESSTGIFLVIAAVLAMLTANSPMQGWYQSALNQYLFGLSVHHWINDGLMAVFFLMIGLEVKQELIDGSLKKKETAIFPVIAAVGGMLVPALIYGLFNYHDTASLQGWAIPAATDIAFALGIMALLGERVPVSLKIFLLALAIIDDLGVIVIIAFFYSADLSQLFLFASLVLTIVLFVMNHYRVTRLIPYLMVGCLLWVAVLKSGIHATLAGVILGFAIPIQGKENGDSPLKTLEHALHPYVAFIILPVFAYANAGLSLNATTFDALLNPVPLGVALGLLLGKPLGVFVFSWLAIRMKMAQLPDGIELKHIFAVSVLCGIGFTMSIFISSLAFGDNYTQLDVSARFGILVGSTLAAVVGYFLLSATLAQPKKFLAGSQASTDKTTIKRSK